MTLTFDLQGVGALMLAAAAAVSDLRTRKIPNGLTGAGALSGLVVAALASLGWLQLPSAVLLPEAARTGGVTLLLAFLCFAAGLLGGGDAKLFAAMAVWLGCPGVVELLLYSTAAGLVMAVWLAAAAGKLRALLGAVVVVPAMAFVPALRQRVDARLLGLELPLGIAVFAGAIVRFLGPRLTALA